MKVSPITGFEITLIFPEREDLIPSLKNRVVKTACLSLGNRKREKSGMGQILYSGAKAHAYSFAEEEKEVTDDAQDRRVRLFWRFFSSRGRRLSWSPPRRDKSHTPSS
jgi:hypothetical protein